MNEQELKAQLEQLEKNLKVAASEDAKKQIQSQIDELKKSFPDTKAIEKSVDEVKTSVEGVAKSVKEISEWQVKKDEADKANQEALDKLISESKKVRDIQEKSTKSFGQALEEAMNEGDNFKNIEMLATNHKDRSKRFSIELKAVGDVAVSTNYTGGSRALQVLRDGIIQNPPRKVHVRELLPGGGIGQGTEFVFMRENGDGEGAIATVAEGATKSQFDVDLAESSVKIETIAGWMRVTRKAMNNIPGFLSFLQTRLPEKLLKVEDSQILTGDGTSPNLKGIMTAGNFTAATSAETTLIEQLIDSIAQLEDDEDRSATGILLRPVDYFGFFKNKAAGSGEYDLPQNVTFVNGVLYISGIPVFASTAAQSGKYVVGDWQMGAQLLTQEAMRVEFFEQDSTNVRENKITVRIEETIALPVYGDNYFIVGDVPTQS